MLGCLKLRLRRLSVLHIGILGLLEDLDEQKWFLEQHHRRCWRGVLDVSHPLATDIPLEEEGLAPIRGWGAPDLGTTHSFGA